MKKLLLILFVGVISITSKAQNELPKVIQDINTDVEKINKEKGFLMLIRDLTDSDPFTPFSDGVWINDNQITKIRVVEPISERVAISEYYFKNSRLIFTRVRMFYENTEEEDLQANEYPINDTNFRKGYFSYDELMGQDYLIYEGKDTLFWGARMQRKGYKLWKRYQKQLNFNPYSKMQYDSIVAYDFDGRGGVTITNGKDKLDKTAKNGAKLSKLQIDSLLITVADTNTYGGMNSMCFNPRMGIVFYNKGEITSTINICFECNSMVADENLPAMGYHTLIGGGDDYIVRSPRYGFTPLGRKRLKAICSQLGLKYCPEESFWDKDPDED